MQLQFFNSSSILSSNSAYKSSLERIEQGSVGGGSTEGDNVEEGGEVGHTEGGRVGDVEGGNIEDRGRQGDVEGDKGRSSICRGNMEDGGGESNVEGDRGGDTEGREGEDSVYRGNVEDSRRGGSSRISSSLSVRSSEISRLGLRPSEICMYTGEYCNLALTLLPFAKSYIASSFAIVEVLTIIEVGAVELTMNKCSLLIVLEGYFLHSSFQVDSILRKKVELILIIVVLLLFNSLVKAYSLVCELILWQCCFIELKIWSKLFLCAL